MRSYETARGLLSFLGFLAWCAIVVGILVAIGAGSAVSQVRSFGVGGGAMAGVAAAMPGLILAFLGFLALAQVQMGRAGVDTAEYTQQMLKIARDQLEVSRQNLKQGDMSKQSFAAMQANGGDKPAEEKAIGRDSYSAAPRPARDVAPLDQHELGEILIHQGKKIRVVEAGYLFNGIAHPTLEDAQAKIELKLGKSPVSVSAPRVQEQYQPGETITYRTKTIRVVEAGFVFGAQTYNTLVEAKAKIDEEGRFLPPEPQLTRTQPDPVEVTPADLSASFKRS